METQTLMICVALLAGLATMPALNIFKICAGNVGTMKVDPWRIRTASAVQKASARVRSWLASIWTQRLAFACLAVLLAVLVAHLSASHEGVALAVAAPTLITLRADRAKLIRAAEKLKKADGTFADDEARTAFDAKMTEVEDIDEKIRVMAEPTPAPVADPPVVSAETRAQILKDERIRVKAIQDAVRVAGLDATFAVTLVERGDVIEDARAAIFVEMDRRAKATNVSGHQAAGGDDEHDKFQRGALNWLLIRSGHAKMVAKAENVDLATINPGEFRGLSLLDLARMSLERAGVNTRGLEKMQLVSQAFMQRATQSTSDFTVLLENLMNKVLQAQYSITPDTWRAFCATSSNPDFRPANRYRWGNLSVLDSLTENGEFKTKALSDAEKASLTLLTKGNIINVSRQMIVNDDMGAFTRLPQMMGRAAALSVEVDVYALLALNSGDGPTMGDGFSLFDNTHHANKPTGAALSAAALDLDRVAMASQKEPNGNDYTDLRPAILVVPVGLGGQARVINQSQYDPDTVANKSQMKPNIVVGLFREIIDSPRVTASTTRRYLFADKDIAPVLEVAFLEGQEAPVLETQNGWRTDGAEMKVRFDYIAGAVDYRGAVSNAGV